MCECRGRARGEGFKVIRPCMVTEPDSHGLLENENQKDHQVDPSSARQVCLLLLELVEPRGILVRMDVGTLGLIGQVASPSALEGPFACCIDVQSSDVILVINSPVSFAFSLGVLRFKCENVHTRIVIREVEYKCSILR